MDPSRLNVVFTYRNFAGHQGVSHTGLAVAATNLMKVMSQNGITCRTEPLDSVRALRRLLDNDPSITHVIISALWIPPAAIADICDNFTRTHICINCHSNVGFLQTDPRAIADMRALMALERTRYNLHVAGNSEAFCEFVIRAYGVPCTYLPNLYYLDALANNVARPVYSGGVLRVGIFGANRWQKNFVTATAAFAIAAREMKVQAEMWINTGRRDGPETGNVYQAAANVVAGIPNVALKLLGWRAWPEFREYVASMHVLVQPSYTESFNMVTADGVSSGVPSAVSPAIDWTPEDWQCDVDDAGDVATTIERLAVDPTAATRGLTALSEHNSQGVDAWLRMLVGGSYGMANRTWPVHGVAKYASLSRAALPHANLSA